MPDYTIRQRDRGQAEAKCLRPRPNLNISGIRCCWLCPRHRSGLL